jgi:LmbE family N-acetylglucosaminyl deacetylase
MKRTFLQTTLALLVVSFLLTAPRAQQTSPATRSPEDRAALYQALLDLTNPWTVMCIAAHPDDEDGTSLIVMRRKYGAHTVSLFSTFGEGGQNAIGPELYEELGAIRARETMAAAEIQGSEPHFLGLKDFGYSKSADEAFKVWGHEEALRRMVLEIRKLRPDVIITNHSVTNNDHGHHQATARLELEAFDAAADPTRFPEQLKDSVTVWQVQRLFVRAGRSNQVQAETSPIVTIDPNERDAIRDTVFAEEALRALQKHATQGPWPKTFAEFAARFRAFTGQSAAPGQLPLIRYVLVREAKGAGALTKDSHNFLDGLQLPDVFAKQLGAPGIDAQALADSVNDRALVFEKLLSLRISYDDLQKSEKTNRFYFMRQRVERALALAAGVNLKVETSVVTTPGSTADLPLTLSNQGIQSINVMRCSACAAGSVCLDDGPQPAQPGFKAENLAPGSFVNRSNQLQIPEKMPVNTPLSSHLYEPGSLGLEMISSCWLQMAKGRIYVWAPTRVNVAPPVEIESITPSPYVFTPANLNKPLPFKIRLVNRLRKSFQGEFGVSSPSAHINEAGAATITLGSGETREFSLESNVIPVDTPTEQRTPRADFGSIVFSVHPPESATEITKAATQVVYADAHVALNLRVGYVRGFDYSLPNALNALGVESKELSVDEVKTADLQKYTSIIVDNRVYESTLGLIGANQKLLDYANAGGTLIVFYHKSFEWNPDPKRNRPQLAPYKLILGDERIVDENAPITFLEPQHPLLNSPNKLGQEDFANWIQERGLYYPKEWDPQFHALLQSNDPGEAPLKGGLLVADFGRGHYIYTSMVWYRELRAGVPGAYRMLANMISYGR